MNVQAIITNISFPKTLSELEYFLEERGGYDLEYVLNSKHVEWSVPKWSAAGDIVFFFHAKYAHQHISRLRHQLYSDPENNKHLKDFLDRGQCLHKEYGGKIFAIGKVVGKPFYDGGDWQESVHWQGRVYAEIGEIFLLANPFPLDEFSDFLMLSRQSAVTPVLGDDFERIRELILRSNPAPKYFKDAVAVPLPLKDIDPENWLEITAEYRRRFYLEKQFRKYYADYFLREISAGRRLWAECACLKNGRTGYADNCIQIGGKLLFCEVKLNAAASSGLTDQLRSYLNPDEITLGHKKLKSANLADKILLIDAESLSIFAETDAEPQKIADLDDIKTHDDLRELRGKIIELIN